MTVRGLLRACATSVALTGVLAACGSQHPTSRQLDGPVFREDLESWSLPLDAYIPGPRLLAHAQNVLYSQCMQAHGIETIPYDVADYLPPDRNKVLRLLFNTTLARKYGYHSGPTKKDPARVPRPHLSSATEMAEDAACSQAAKSRVNVNDQLTGLVQSLAAQAAAASETDSAVTGTISAWRRCLQPLHLPDLPSSPTAMPTPSQRRLFGMDGPVNPSQSNPPKQHAASLTEIRQATTDARCQDSSKYTRTSYQAEIRNQLQLINEHQDQLARALDATRSSTETITSIIQTCKQIAGLCGH